MCTIQISEHQGRLTSISSDSLFHNSKLYSVLCSSLVLIKRGVVIEADKTIAHQLRILSLNDGSPYETLHAYISAAVSPYFKSYVKESGRVDKWILFSPFSTLRWTLKVEGTKFLQLSRQRQSRPICWEKVGRTRNGPHAFATKYRHSRHISHSSPKYSAFDEKSCRRESTPQN